MTGVIEDLTDAECRLLALLNDRSGLDLAEFAWYDPDTPQGCWRAWPFQWKWFRCEDTLQIDQCARSVGKTLSITLRMFAFPFLFPGQEAVVTAPELVHLEPLTGLIERRVQDTRLGREMIPRGRSAVTHRPFQLNFVNGSRIMGRIPQRDGKGVKGIHPVWLELDEASDYPKDGWTELIETLKRGHAGAVWRAHGVTRGVRDNFHKFTRDAPDNPWKVHRFTAMSRPNWTDQERQEKISQYGSRDHPDYRRNVLGLHGDATNPLFVLHRLMQAVDDDLSSTYNLTEYAHISISHEQLTDRGENHDVIEFLDFPASHRSYKNTWVGMDVGYTNHPSEIMVFGEVPVKDKITKLKLLTRIHLERISNPQQVRAICHVMNWYHPHAFSMDKMQPVSEPVLTPSGWVPIGSLNVGDFVTGSDGKPTKVTGVYPQVDCRVMKVKCSDGSWTRCGPNHLWTVKNVNHKRPAIMTTEQLAQFVDAQRQRAWTIPMLSSPAEFSAQSDLLVDPYVLGLLLGDGNLRDHSIRFSSADPEILFELESRLSDGLMVKHESGCDYSIVSTQGWRTSRGRDGKYVHSNVLLDRLRDLGLAGLHAHDKSVPAAYMLASPEDRLALLQGIMDTDGYVNRFENSSAVCIRVTSEQLTRDVIALVESLGGSGRYRTHPTSCNGKPGRQAHVATIHLPGHLSPFLLTRKREQVVPRTLKPLRRYVSSVVPDGDEASVCIRVEAEDELYVTRHCLVTHNTGVGLPLFQDLQGTSPAVAEAIRGYNFSEKILVDFDEAEVAKLKEGDDDVKEAGIKRNVLEYATDKLRELVDREPQGILLPWDTGLIAEFQGQTWAYSKEAMDMYGRRRRVYSGGSSHALDGCRMAVLGYVQHTLEEMMRMRKIDDTRPVYDYFEDGGF